MRACVLYPFIKTRDNTAAAAHRLQESEALATALNLSLIHSATVPMRGFSAGLLFARGKLDELAGIITDKDIGLVVIDGALTPVQQRNLERRWKIKVIDRTGLILDIFAKRAKSHEGVLQVELAQLTYQKSRLVRSWTHLERQRGGLQFVGGAGESQIESDRRALDNAIVRIKRRLDKIVKTRNLHRAARRSVPYPIVALAGYTNAGKSTVFNALTGAGVVSKDMLFATLDPTMRMVRLPSGREVIVSDTVGFISALPTELIAAFRSTLEEITSADVVLHIHDSASARMEEQARDVRRILTQLGVMDEAGEGSVVESVVDFGKDFGKDFGGADGESDAEPSGSSAPQIEVYNKIDLLEGSAFDTLQNKAERQDNMVLLSAIDGRGLDKLCAAIDVALHDKVRDKLVAATLRLGFDEGKRRAWLFEQNVIVKERQLKAGFKIEVSWTAEQAVRFERMVNGEL